MSKPYLTIKVIIADDHELVREGLQVMINKIPELEIIGEATNGEDLVKITRRLKPDVVLTDVRMPKMDGIEATRIIKKELPHVGVIALSSFDEENLIVDMLNAGAKGYLLKNASKKEITEAVQCAHKDQPYYCKHTNFKLAQMIAKGGYFDEKKQSEKNFTERELQVIQLICQEFTSKEIAARLGLRPRTVERYRDTIMEKMDVNNATGVVMYAVKYNLCSPST